MGESESEGEMEVKSDVEECRESQCATEESYASRAVRTGGQTKARINVSNIDVVNNKLPVGRVWHFLRLVWILAFRRFSKR